MLETYSQLVAA